VFCHVQLVGHFSKLHVFSMSWTTAICIDRALVPPVLCITHVVQSALSVRYLVLLLLMSLSYFSQLQRDNSNAVHATSCSLSMGGV